MSTSFRTIFAGLAFAGLMALGYACSDTNGGSSRTGGGDTTSGGAGGGSTTTSSGTTSSGTTSSTTTSSGPTTTGPTTTSGAGGGSTTTSTGSAGGTTSTTTGMGGASGTGGAGGSGNSMACGSNGQPYTGPLLGRCAPTSCTDKNCGTSVGKGGFLTLDDFETVGFTTPVTGGGTINMTWPSRDGRNGGWHQYS